GGSLLSHFEQCQIVHVTDGAPLELRDAQSSGFNTRRDYAQARREEAAEALSLAGISKNQIIELGVIDQQSSYQLVSLALRLSSLLHEIKPEIVLTQPYEGGHPDHDSTAFVVHAARQLLISERSTAPQIFEMTSYYQQNEKTIYSDFLWTEHCMPVTLKL